MGVKNYGLPKQTVVLYKGNAYLKSIFMKLLSDVLAGLIYIKKVRKCVIHYGLFSLNNSMSSNPSFKIENVSILSGFAKRK